MTNPLINLKPFTKRKNYQANSQVFYELENRSVTSYACNSSHFGSQKDLTFRTNKKHVVFSDKDMEQWVIFMNECGFPCTLEITKDEVIVHLKRKDYENNTHYKCGITAIRYPFYAFNPDHEEIAKQAIDIYLEKKMSPHESLCEAHNKINLSNYTDYNHRFNKRCKILTKKEMLAKTKTVTTVNKVYEV